MLQFDGGRNEFSLGLVDEDEAFCSFPSPSDDEGRGLLCFQVLKFCHGVDRNWQVQFHGM